MKLKSLKPMFKYVFKIKNNALSILTFLLVVTIITGCNTSQPCYNNKHKEVRMNKKL